MNRAYYITKIIKQSRHTSLLSFPSKVPETYSNIEPIKFQIQQLHLLKTAIWQLVKTSCKNSTAYIYFPISNVVGSFQQYFSTSFCHVQSTLILTIVVWEPYLQYAPHNNVPYCKISTCLRNKKIIQNYNSQLNNKLVASYLQSHSILDSTF